MIERYQERYSKRLLGQRLVVRRAYNFTSGQRRSLLTQCVPLGVPVTLYSPPAMSKYPLKYQYYGGRYRLGTTERPPRSILTLVTRYRQVMVSIHPDRRRIKHRKLNPVL